MVRRSPAGLKAQLNALGRFNSTKHLAAVSCPSLVVHGHGDGVIPFANAASLAAKVPGAKLLEWGEDAGNAGHFFWLDKPVDLVAELDDFFKLRDN